jgi:hypothetical protein
MTEIIKAIAISSSTIISGKTRQREWIRLSWNKIKF